MLSGNIIFPMEASALLKEYNKKLKESKPHIIFVESLTIDVAFYVLNNSVCGIITEESSFATHGANILRCYYNKTNESLSWVSGVKRQHIEYLFEKNISILSTGEICEPNKLGGDFKQKNKCKEVNFSPLKKRSIMEYDISRNSYSICYWPHRKYNVLTFSVMEIGLKKNLFLFGYDNISITLDDLGQIWFDNAPSISLLSKLAKDNKYASSILLKQINLYERLYDRLKGEVDFNDITEILIEYFSVFLLFHDTYEDVLVKAYEFFKGHLGKSVAYEIMNILMSCCLDKWMLDKKIILEKRKNLLSKEEIVPLPPFSISYDIECSIKNFSTIVTNLGSEKFYNENAEFINFLVKFFVAKEWKFIMNKIIFTRFSNILIQKIPEISFEELSSKNIVALKQIIKEKESEKLQY